jgi:hypothetical protein
MVYEQQIALRINTNVVLIKRRIIMNSNHQKRNFFSLAALLLLLAIAGITACNESNTTAPQEAPPEIPPVSTFKIDLLSDFDTTQAPLLSNNFNKSGAVLTKQNWGWAAINVGIWNVAITLTMIVPVAAFQASLTQTPVQQPDGSWLWSYSFTPPGGVLHTAKLSAKAVDGDIQWKMLISKQNVFTDFEWYTGVCNLVLKEGSWRLNKDPMVSPPTPFLDIEWHRNPQQSSADVKYTIIDSGNILENDYIFYGINNETPYDTFYDIFDSDQNNLIEIEWDRAPEQKDGRIKDPRHFGDTEWRCWDIISNGLEDITCP